MATIRTFVAIDLPGEIKMELDKLISGLRQAASDIRWVRAANLHLTLRFLGELPMESIKDLAVILQENLKGFDPFEISLAGLGGFPNLKRARVIWVGGGRGCEGLENLAPLVESSCKQSGFGPADKPFSPHLTIGRVKFPKGHERLIALIESMRYESPLFQVKDVVIFKSELLPAGPRYTMLESIEL